eukprot:3023194-Pyramimonas_sp.AAC.1
MFPWPLAATVALSAVHAVSLSVPAAGEADVTRLEREYRATIKRVERLRAGGLPVREDSSLPQQLRCLDDATSSKSTPSP